MDYQEEGAGVGGYARVMSEGFLKAQAEVFAKQAKDVDIIITTALIPGRPAPKLITAEMVKSMKPGSVIVDLAAEQGGNCELTVPHEVTVQHGVTIIGYSDLPSRLARQSSTLYATNLFRLTEELCKTKDGDHQRQHGRRGDPRHDGGEGGQRHLAAAGAQALGRAAGGGQAGGAGAAAAKKGHGHGATEPMSGKAIAIVFVVGAVLFWFIGANAPAAFLNHFTVFVLACFVGYMVVWNVTPALHTPLMSVTNAISSIIAIGALVQIAPPLADTRDAADRPDELDTAGWRSSALALTSDQHVRRLRRHAAHAGRCSASEAGSGA